MSLRKSKTFRRKPKEPKKVAKRYYVYYDAACSGWYSNHGRYADEFDAEIFAKEIVRRLGGQAKIKTKDLGPRLFLGHVGSLETWSDGRGEYAGYRSVFDPKKHEWIGKK